MTKRLVVFFLLAAAGPVQAQESKVASELRREREHIADACDELRSIGSCLYTLATDYPLHVALGSLAPQSGFAFGLAFSERFTPNESWRLSWNADAVATPSGAWRAGAYMKFVHTPETSGVIVRPAGTPAATTTPIAPREFAVIDLFAQAISLESLNYFGAGPDSLEQGRSRYDESQTILGGAVTYPLGALRAIAALEPALVAGVNGRFLDVTSRSTEGVPGIGEVYDEASAPGLTEQQAFVEFHEGLRLAPSIANGWLRLNYLFAAAQFRTNGETRASFNRWIADLQHEIPLYRKVASPGPQAFNGPNDCGASAAGACPPPQWSRNRHGTIRIRGLLVTSTTSGDDRVPFYFQPTLGGSDLNGERRLASFADYRFRDSNLLALQQSVEYAIAGPFGVFLQTEEGTVAPRAAALSLKDFSASTTLGVTLRAGAFPLVNLSFSWGAEGHHVIGAMDTTLLGGSPRPSLY